MTRTLAQSRSTASTHEFLMDGAIHLASWVAGLGWFEPRSGCVEDINDDGTLADADGTERRLRWRAGREGT